jgi:hypothetical protein
MSYSISLNAPVSIRYRIAFNPKLFLTLSFCLIFGLLIFYIFQINDLVSRGYLLHAHQKNVETLTQENERMGANLAGAYSLKNVESLVKAMGFEKTGKIHYIQILENSVAQVK